MIHSHNKMGVFFSGTDNDELIENSPNYNYYLSLIVNNDMKMCAKIAFVGEVEPVTYKFRGLRGKQHILKGEKETAIFCMDMEVFHVFDPTFIDKADEIISSPDKNVYVHKPYGGNSNYTPSIQREKTNKEAEESFEKTKEKQGTNLTIFDVDARKYLQRLLSNNTKETNALFFVAQKLNGECKTKDDKDNLKALILNNYYSIAESTFSNSSDWRILENIEALLEKAIIVLRKDVQHMMICETIEAALENCIKYEQWTAEATNGTKTNKDDSNEDNKPRAQKRQIQMFGPSGEEIEA